MIRKAIFALSIRAQRQSSAAQTQIGWICRYDIAEACRLALEAPDITWEIFFIGSTLQLFERVDVQRTIDVLNWRPEYDFQEYRSTNSA